MPASTSQCGGDTDTQVTTNFLVPLNSESGSEPSIDSHFFHWQVDVHVADDFPLGSLALNPYFLCPRSSFLSLTSYFIVNFNTPIFSFPSLSFSCHIFSFCWCSNTPPSPFLTLPLSDPFVLQLPGHVLFSFSVPLLSPLQLSCDSIVLFGLDHFNFVFPFPWFCDFCPSWDFSAPGLPAAGCCYTAAMTVIVAILQFPPPSLLFSTGFHTIFKFHYDVGHSANEVLEEETDVSEQEDIRV